MRPATPTQLDELRRLAARYGLSVETVVDRIALRPKEIASTLGVALRTVEGWIAEGSLPAAKRGRVVMVALVDLLRFLEENQVQPRTRNPRNLQEKAASLIGKVPARAA